MGTDPGELEIDHIDCDKLNNNIWNLRPLTPKANKQRLGSGITERRGRYQARVAYQAKRFYLGTFDTQDEAREAQSAFIRDRQNAG